MTSALELFCSRRTRLGRGSGELELESGSDLRLSHPRRNFEFERRQSSRRHGLDGCVPLRRPSQSRMSSYGSGFAEGAPFELNDGASQSPHATANSVAEEGLSVPSSRSRVTCVERLPGAVLQARERLFQRLRGAAVSDRRSRRPTSNILIREFGRLVDPGDWETDVFLGFSPGEDSSATSSIFHSEQCKKPLGLAQEVLNSLPVEIFGGRDTECGLGSEASDDKLISWDCSICLEKFSDGNQLVCLPCSHRFHIACLGQWGLIRGDCPCCRRSIV